MKEAEEAVVREKVLIRGGQAEYVEKRSRFIAQLIPVESEEKAEEEIDRIRKKYYDARHNCYAYIVYDRENGVIERSGDDGEPSGTAGRPMLEVLVGNKIRNVLAVVTRYFGGTLLGTGGLVRAYSTAVKEALMDSGLTEVQNGTEIVLKLDYNTLSKVQYRMRELGISEIASAYENDVSMTLAIPDDSLNRFKKDLTEVFAGKEQIESEKPIVYGELNGTVFIL